jgi:nitroimidazol reductase NimA-like FMN-containing flavoprotein (pyridoxamine 5'-phosphate oxidase superfamily)
MDIMNRCDVCRIAFHAEKYPYIIPMNFGFRMQKEILKLYFHCATEGTKLELLKMNANVAFEMDCSHNLLLGDIACNSTMEYESVCGNGVLRIVDDTDKLDALNIIMDHYDPKRKHEFSYNEVKAVVILELQIDELHGKRLKKH